MNTITRFRHAFVLSGAFALASAALGQSVGHATSAAESAKQSKDIPAGSPPSRTLFAVQESLDRIARANEAQAAAGKSAEDKQREDSDLKAQEDMARWAKLMFFATAFSVGLSGVGVFLIAWTLAATRRAANAAEGAVTETKNATNAALKAVDEAKKATAQQLRAYVNVASVFAQWLDEPDDVPMKMVKFVLNYQNTGQTPAHNVTAWMIARSMPPDTQQFNPEGVGRAVDSVGVLGHGQVNHVRVEKQVDIAHGVLKAWKSGAESLFVFGAINYIDAFGEPRVTEFRLMMPREGVGVGKGEFLVCREGNKST